ncbi:MAG: hypothetical protein JWP09_818 [Candidatus Taylorbacteria bacterium]|nr:hypothetical protein [Candidatus Taylorbacteria bacterium]
MKKRHLGVLILIIILAFVAGYLWQVTHKLGELKSSIQEIRFGGKQDKYEIDAAYPVIESGVPENIKNSINTELEKWARDGAEKSKSEFEDLLKDPELAGSDLGLMYSSTVSVKSDFKKLPYINVSFEIYDYSGGAHGITAVSTFVYDANTGEKITLDKVFSGNYLNTLSTLSLAELKKTDPKLETYSFAEDGTKPVADNFQTWTLEPDGIHFVFSDYQVGPYSSGRPEIVLSYESLNSVLNPEFKKSLY